MLWVALLTPYTEPAASLPSVGAGLQWAGNHQARPTACRVKSRPRSAAGIVGKQGCRPRSTRGGFFQPKPRPGNLRAQFLLPASEDPARPSWRVGTGFAHLFRLHEDPLNPCPRCKLSFLEFLIFQFSRVLGPGLGWK